MGMAGGGHCETSGYGFRISVGCRRWWVGCREGVSGEVYGGEVRGASFAFLGHAALVPAFFSQCF